MQKDREKILILFFLAITIPYCKYFITRQINNTHARMWGSEVSPPGNINKRYLHGKISENAPRTLISTSQNFALILFNTQRYKGIFVRTLTCNKLDFHD